MYNYQMVIPCRVNKKAVSCKFKIVCMIADFRSYNKQPSLATSGSLILQRNRNYYVSKNQSK